MLGPDHAEDGFYSDCTVVIFIHRLSHFKKINVTSSGKPVSGTFSYDATFKPACLNNVCSNSCGY